jgi:hypothetical protein
MKLLIAVDSAISTEVLVGAVGVRPWPDGTNGPCAQISRQRSGLLWVMGGALRRRKHASRRLRREGAARACGHRIGAELQPEHY